MKRLKRILMIGVLSLCVVNANAQGWALDMVLTTDNCYNTVGALNYTLNGSAHQILEYDYTNGVLRFVIKSTDALKSTGNTLTVSSSISCNPSSPIATYYSNTFTFNSISTCSENFFTNVTGNFSVDDYVFYPRLSISNSEDCSGITTLSTQCTGGNNNYPEMTENNALWQIATNPSGSWTTLTGKTTSVISLSVSELTALGYTTPYTTIFYARVSDTNLSGRTSAVESFHFYAPSPAVSIIGSTDVICKGESNGTITLMVSNTVSAVNQFYINCFHEDGSSKPEPVVASGNYQITGLKAGNWQFQVVNNYDKSTYGVCNTTVSSTVNEPAQLTVGFTTPLNNGYAIKCNGGSTGETTAIGSGGVGGYKDFSWNTGATTDKITGLIAGTYTVSLKDANNCSATNQIFLQEPSALQVSLSKATDYNSYPVSCWNKSDGGISSTVSGGVTSYTYQWSTGATNSSVSGLGIGTYSVTVTDANSCTTSSSLALTAPAKIDFTIDQLTTLTCPGDKTATLEGKPVAATIIGSAHYVWSSGETTATITNIGAGTYPLTVSDDQGCSTTKSIVLSDPAANTVSIIPQSNFNGSFIKCNGDSDGILAAVVKDENSNVISAQDYLWTGTNSTIGEGATLTSINNLSEGQYKVVITYRTQCKAEASYFLSDPDPVVVNISVTSNYNGQPISCYNQTDAKLHAVATGGTSTLVYSWNTGATGSLLSGIGAGSYTATVNDVNGCTGTNTIELQNPELVQALITDVSDYSGFGVSCYGVSDGSITSEGSGGTGVYTYSWSNGKATTSINSLAADTYTLTVSDNNGCKQSVEQVISSPAVLALSVASQKNISCFNGSDGTIELKSSGGAGSYIFSKDNKAKWQSENIFSSLVQGSYTIVLHDGNGCEKNTTAVLTQPSKINISFSNIEPAFCNNPTGTATAVVTGGVSGYAYHWQDSKSNLISTDVMLKGVNSGIYTLLVQDKNACPISNTVAITSNDGAKSTYTSTAAKCFDSSDGSAAITVTEGDGPFVIEWPDGQNTLQGTNLKKGLYDVLITDSHNCAVIQTVDIPAPDALQLTVKNEVTPTCNGACDGQLTLEATGGVGSYVYEWNNNTSAQQSQLCAAVYPVVLKDANNCTLSQDVELKHPDPIQITVTTFTLPTCKDGCDGSLEIAATGGNGGYAYTWAVGGNSTIKNSLCPGSYGVAVTDAKGCKGESTVTLDNTPALPLDLGGGVTLCVGQTYTLDAGSGWKSTTWGGSTGLTSSDQKITIKDAGNYWVEVLSDKGCIAQDTFLLETSYDLLKAALLMQSEAAVGDTVVMIDISWPLPESVEWKFPTGMNEVLNLDDAVFGQFSNAGTYEVSLTAHLGECVDEVTKSITILKDETASAGGRLGYEEFVKKFTLYPNPNDGAFDVGIELVEQSPVTISVWNSPTGIMIRQVQLNGKRIYQISFDLRPVSSGAYVLRLDHAKGKEYLRFIVQ